MATSLVNPFECGMSARIRLGALPSASGVGRRFVSSLLTDWDATELIDDACTVTSELVTNSVAATGRTTGPSQPMAGETVRMIVLRIELTDAQLKIAVWDNSTDLPTPRDTDDEDEHGRGLLIVKALSAEWGSFLAPEPPSTALGKNTWCVLARQAPLPPTCTEQLRPAVPTQRPVPTALPRRKRRPSTTVQHAPTPPATASDTAPRQRRLINPARRQPPATYC